MKKYISIFSLMLTLSYVFFLLANPSHTLATTTADEDTISEQTLHGETKASETIAEQISEEETETNEAVAEQTSEEATETSETIVDEASSSTVNSDPPMVRSAIQPFAYTGIMGFPGVSTDYNTPLDSKYSFFPRMSSNSEWYYEASNTLIKPTNKAQGGVIPINTMNSPGALRVTNVGRYKGINLDLLIEVTYLNKVDDKGIFGNVLIPATVEIGAEPSNFLNLYMAGAKNTEVNLRLTTLEHGTKNKIKTSGVVTYNQITKMKALLLPKNQISRLYTPANSILQYDGNTGVTINGGQDVYAFQSSVLADETTNRLVQQYEDLESRAVGIKMLQTSSSVTQRLNSPPPLTVKPMAPSITGDSTIKKPTENSAYTLYQAVPPQPSTPLKSFNMIVGLESVLQTLDPDTVIIKDQNNEIIGEDKLKKEVLTNEDGEQILEISATDAYLNSNLSDGSGLYSNSFEVTVPVKMDYTKDYSKYLLPDPDGDLIKIKAFALLFVDGFDNEIENWRTESSPIVFRDQSLLTLDFRNENNERLFKDEIQQKVGSSYEYTKEMFDNRMEEAGLTILSISDNAKGIQTPEEITVIYTVKDQRFTSDIEFYKDELLVEDDTLRWGDKVTVKYRLQYNGKLAPPRLDPKFKHGSMIVADLPENLPNIFEDLPTNMELVDGEGNAVGQVTYQEEGTAGQIIGEINEGVSVGTDIYLKYDATISNKVAADSQVSFPLTVTVYDDLLEAKFTKTSSKKVTIIPNTAAVTVNFLDEKGNPLHEAYTSMEEVNTPIDLTEISAVTDILANLQKDNYELVKRPDQEQFRVVSEGNNVTYQFAGVLKILSAPSTFDFGTKKATINAVKYTNPIIEQPLIISDTRVDGGKWRLKAKIDQPLTGPTVDGQPIILPDAIKYKTADDELALSNQDEVVFDYQDGRGSYNVTQERWSKGDGFILDLKPGAIKALGKYQAKMTITLENAK